MVKACYDLAPFLKLGQAIRAMPYPFCCCWLVVLMIGILLAPMRMERTTDIIDTWLPVGGQARYARDFVTENGWQLSAWTNKMPGLKAQLDRLDIDQESDYPFFRSTRVYYHIWAADKNWDYSEDTVGASILTKKHFREWYDFQKLLWEKDYLVNGENWTYPDVCTKAFATNAFYTGKWGGLGFGPGKYDNVLGTAALNTPYRTWDSISYLFPDVNRTGEGEPLSNFPEMPQYSEASHAHQEFSALGAVEGTSEALNLLLSTYLPFCEGDSKYWQPNCIRGKFIFKDSGLTLKHDYIHNCKFLMGMLHPEMISLLQDPNITVNEKVQVCASAVIYASIPGATEFEMACQPADFVYCVKDSVTELFGSLFRPPFLDAVYPGWDSLPTESWFTDPNISNETFFAHAKANCQVYNYTTADSGRYARASKYIDPPVNLARRLQIRAGNCSLQHPSTELINEMYMHLAYSESIQKNETAYWGAMEALHSCLMYEPSRQYQEAIEDIDVRIPIVTLNITDLTAENDAVGLAEAQAELTDLNIQRKGLIDNINGMGFPTYDSVAYQDEKYSYALACTLATVTGLPAIVANASAGAKAVGVGQHVFMIWYKASMWYECPEFNDEVINTAMGIADQFYEQMDEEVHKFNERSEYLTASLLTARQEGDSYKELFTSNVLIASIAIFLFILICTVLHWKVASVAFFGVILILLVVVATFGYMPPPYTPSTIQFLPYLCLGIGVDDLFVVLKHYYDEDNIPKTIHHAGSVITMTSSVNLLIFLSLYFMSNVPDFQIFTIAASIGVCLLYFNIILGVVPLLAIHEKLFQKDKKDPCRPTDTFHDSQFKSRPNVDPHFAYSSHSGHNYVAFSKALEPLKCIGTPICLLLSFIGFTVLAFMKIEGHGFDKIDFGLELSQLLKTDVEDHTFRSIVIFERYPLYTIACGTNKKWESSDYMPRVFDDIAPRYLQFFWRFNEDREGGIPYTSYLSGTWVQRAQNAFMTNPNSANPNPTFKEAPYPNRNYSNFLSTYPVFPSTSNFWYDHDKFHDTDIVWPQQGIFISPRTGGKSVEGRLLTEIVRDVYDQIEDYKDIGIYCTSSVLNIYERYLDVEDTLNMGFIVAAIIVFIVGMIVIQDVGSVLILTLVDLVTAYQLWGFYGFATLRINSFLTMCIMLGAAFTVQYTAHVNRRFVLSKAPSRWYRVVDALSTYTGPIMWGGFTTALAVSAAAFMPAKYFRLYFFYSFIIMVGFGLFNGLCVQCALLVMIPINCATASIPMFGSDDNPGKRYSASEERLGTATKQFQIMEMGITAKD